MLYALILQCHRKSELQFLKKGQNFFFKREYKYFPILLLLLLLFLIKRHLVAICCKWISANISQMYSKTTRQKKNKGHFNVIKLNTEQSNQRQVKSCFYWFVCLRLWGIVHISLDFYCFHFHVFSWPATVRHYLKKNGQS